MSAAVNRPHDVFSSRPHLPLTGEFHPLRREFERLLFTGNAIALTFAMLACTIVHFWPRSSIVKTAVIDMPVIEPGNYWADPGQPSGGPHHGGVPDVIREHFVPDPVKEIEHIDDPADEPGVPGEPGPEESVVDTRPGPAPELKITPPEPPSDYVWFDSEPVLLSCEPPVYPDIVRDAGIDGTVHVRVLVGVNGKVKRAYVVEGPTVLRDAAVESALTAVFRPALQGIHPVEVWVVIPVTFQLRATD